ncbi:MAG: hypothetical protein MHM6MM_003709 [Cercozoa sp. M6MM]
MKVETDAQKWLVGGAFALTGVVGLVVLLRVLKTVDSNIHAKLMASFSPPRLRPRGWRRYRVQKRPLQVFLLICFASYYVVIGILCKTIIEDKESSESWMVKDVYVACQMLHIVLAATSLLGYIMDAALNRFVRQTEEAKQQQISRITSDQYDSPDGADAEEMVRRLRAKSGQMCTRARILHNLCRALLFVVAIIALLTGLGVSLTALLPASALVVAAGMLAFGGLLQDVFGGVLALMTDSSTVNVGEWVWVGGIEGEVIDVHLRCTAIRAADRTMHYVPNRVLLSDSIRNWDQRDYSVQEMRVLLWVTPKEALERLQRFFTAVRQAVREDPLLFEEPGRALLFVDDWTPTAATGLYGVKTAIPEAEINLPVASPLKVCFRFATRRVLDWRADDTARTRACTLLLAAADAESLRAELPSMLDSVDNHRITEGMTLPLKRTRGMELDKSAGENRVDSNLRKSGTIVPTFEIVAHTTSSPSTSTSN